MKRLALFVMITAVQAFFYSQVVIMEPNEITEATDYKFILLHNNYDSNPVIPGGSIFETQFPPELQILDTDAPTTCFRVDNTQTQVALSSCEIINGNMVKFVLDADVNVDSGGPFTYVIGKILNPDRVLNTSTFSIKYKNSSGHLTDIIDSDLIVDSFHPGELQNPVLIFASEKVYEPTRYTFTFSPEHTIFQFGKIKFLFPPNDFELQDTLYLTVMGNLGSAAPRDLDFTVTGSNEVIVTGLFDDGDFVPGADSEIHIYIEDVKNPDSMRRSASIEISTMTQNDELIDQISNNLTVTPREPRGISDVKIYAAPETVHKLSTYTFWLSPDISFPRDGRLTIEIPPSIEVVGVSCSFQIGFDFVVGDGECTNNGNLITTHDVYFTRSSTKQILNLAVTGLKNPSTTKPTEFFKFITYDNYGTVMCQNLEAGTFEANPGQISGDLLTRDSNIAGTPTPYTLYFTPETMIPEGAHIHFSLPKDQMLIAEGETLECHKISGDTVLDTTNLCPTFTEDSTFYNININEWCSTNWQGCAAGTQLRLAFAGVANLPYVPSLSPHSLEIKTYDPNDEYVIDSETSSLTFSPSLATRTLTDVVMQRIGDQVATEIELRLSFTPTIDLQVGTKIHLTLGQSLAYLESTVTCESSNSSWSEYYDRTCSYTLYNTDNSVQTIEIINLCTLTCVQGVKQYISLKQLKNPVSVSPLSNNSWLRTNTVQDYYIELGQIDISNINELTPGTITSVSGARLTDDISSSNEVTFGWTPETEIPNGGSVIWTFPENIMIKISDLDVKLFKDSAELTNFQVTTSADGSLTQLVIEDFCTNTCAAISTEITIKNVKNIDYVKEINGQTSIRTQDSNGYLIDEGAYTTVFGPLIPGSLIRAEVVPENPTVSANTRYRIIFTTTHSIPSDAVVKVQFPADVDVSDRIGAMSTCSAYLTMTAGLRCDVTNRVLKVTEGFSALHDGSWMVSFIIDDVQNPGVVSDSGAFTIEVMTADEYTIDMEDAITTSFTSAITNSSCSDRCATCSGSSSNCYYCPIPSFYPMIRDRSCVTICPNGYFLVEDAGDAAMTCIQCHYSCEKCNGHRSTNCTACSAGLVLVDNRCETECPDGTFELNGVCQSAGACDTPCVTCSSDPSHCLSCDPNSLTPLVQAENGTCLDASCIEGYFASGSSCMPCDFSCATCQGSSEICTSCHTFYDLQYLDEASSNCVSSCPADVSVLIDLACKPCHPTCSTCLTTAADGCKTCPTTGTKYQKTSGECVSECPINTYHYDDTNAFICIEECSDGFFIEVEDRYCRPCDVSCLKCNGAAGTCTECDLDGGAQYFTEDAQCLPACPEDTYTYTLEDKKECYAICPGSSFGLEETLSKTCVEQCPTGTFPNADVCNYCHNSCESCYGEEESNCQTCKGGLLLHKSACINVCPDKFIEDTGACVPNCAATCGSCGEEDLEYCFNCKDDLLLYQGKCYGGCPPKTYESGSNCHDCNLQCSSCETGSECTACEISYIKYGKQCVSQCPGNLVIIGNECKDPVQCLFPCETCYEHTENVCLTCAEPEKLLFANRCVESCPTGTTQTGKTCASCPRGCSACYGVGPGMCSACSAGYDMLSGSCESSCPAGTTRDAATLTCNPVVPSEPEPEEPNPEPTPPPTNNSTETITVTDSIEDDSGTDLTVMEATGVAYMLGGLLIWSGIFSTLGKVLSKGACMFSETVLSMMSVVIMAERLCYFAILWMSPAPVTSVLIGFTGSSLICAAILGQAFLVMHFEPLFESTSSLYTFEQSNKGFMRFIKLGTGFCGIHFARLIYCGAFGANNLTVHQKGVGNHPECRIPLERLCFLALFVANMTAAISQLGGLASYEMATEAFQVALVGVAANSISTGVFLHGWFTNGWKNY